MVDNEDVIRQIVKDAGLSTVHINWNGSPESIWQYVIEEAIQQELLSELLQEMSARFPKKSKLSELYSHLILSSDINFASLANSEQFLGNIDKEVITGTAPSFLPVGYLREGWLASNKVVRIRTSTESGTGFLIGNRMLMTNRHVLPNTNALVGGVADFDYDAENYGKRQEYISFKLDPDRYFVSKTFDICVVGIESSSEFDRTPLAISKEAARIDDRISIIQHPEGAHKQIAMHRNFVVSVVDDKVYYLTDTLPGSSGSPLFNKRWDIVGIHIGSTKIKHPTMNNEITVNIGHNLVAIQQCLEEWNII